MGKFIGLIEDAFVKVAFAEQNVDPDRVLGNEPTAMARTGASVREWVNDTGAAVAFAESGDHDTARMMTGSRKDAEKPGKQEIREHPLFLVVGGRTDFSEELVSYAVEMAGRMKASILALNTGREADEASAAHFSQAADKQGVPFTHMVRPGDKDKVVAELSKAHPNLQYVMTEPSSQKSSYKAIPVYRPAPGMRRTAPRPTIQT